MWSKEEEASFNQTLDLEVKVILGDILFKYCKLELFCLFPISVVYSLMIGFPNYETNLYEI